MNTARLMEAERNLTGIARKVLAHVPLETPADASAIASDLIKSGHNFSRPVVDGCLQSLVADGLVKAVPGGVYLRVQAKRRELQAVPAPAAAPAAPPQLETLAELLEVAAADALALATRLEAAAARARESEQAYRTVIADNEKAQQLRDLLKSML